MGRRVFQRMKNFMYNCSFYFQTRWRVVKCYILSILLYGMEDWYLEPSRSVRNVDVSTNAKDSMGRFSHLCGGSTTMLNAGLNLSVVPHLWQLNLFLPLLPFMNASIRFVAGLTLQMVTAQSNISFSSHRNFYLSCFSMNPNIILSFNKS